MPRIEIVDALRGFAIMAIMFLHNLEHFDFYYFPENLPDWIKTFDGIVWKSLFFLFAGKTYAIFALLFGLTFFIQSNNQAIKGNDFRARFLWRLLLLLGFGAINSIFYQGDILVLYAVLGISLIFVSKLSNKTVFIIAGILILQPYEWGKFFYYLYNPNFVPSPNLSDALFAKMYSYLGEGTFFEAVKGNLTNGRWATIFWSWENGRFFQAVALFMFGMLLGRKRLFEYSEKNIPIWKRILVISIVLFIPLFYLPDFLATFEIRELLLGRLRLIISSLSNMAFMLVLISGFYLIFRMKRGNAILSKLKPFGRMSLTNYIMQSIAGSFVYYGFGLGLFKYTGATYCLFIGIVLFLLQLWFCKVWLKYHKQGPLEYVWHKFTWINFRK